MRENTKQLIKVLNIVENLKRNVKKTHDQFVGELSASLGEEDTAMMEAVFASQRENIDYDLAVREYGKVYEDVFSDEEIGALVSLYNDNPVLQKMIDKNEHLVSEGFRVGAMLAKDAEQRADLVSEAMTQLDSGTAPEA